MRPNFSKTLAAFGLALAFSLSASAQVLTTTFAGGNGLAGAYFDLTATSPITITNFDINLSVGTSATIEIYTVTGGGSWQPVSTNAAAWTMVASFPGVIGVGTGLPTPLPGGLNIQLTPGVQTGFYVTTTSPTQTYTNGTAVGNLFTSNADLQFFEGTGVSYPFAPNNAARVWNGNIYYQSTVSDDLGVTSVLSPSNPPGPCQSLTVAETVTARITNTGINTVNAGTPVTLSFDVDNTGPVIENFFFSNNMLQGQFEDFTFVSTADLSGPGSHTVVVTLAYGPDLNAFNDMNSKTVGSNMQTPISVYPWVENFDNIGATNGGVVVPAGWSNDPTDAGGVATNGQWFNRNAAVPSGSTVTGPTADHTKGVAGQGFYMQVEDAGNFATVNLITPCLDLNSVGAPALGFWLHSKNNTQPTGENFLNIDVITYPGAVPVLGVGGPIGHIGTAWTFQTVDLTAFVGQVIQLRFRGQSSGGGTVHDQCIDDVVVFDQTALNGQASQPGLAVLDINSSVNGLGMNPSAGGPGVYSGTAKIGSTVSFTVSGAPNQPIVLLTGPSSPAIANFPGFGQLDIGTTVNPMTGVPNGLAIVADGTQSNFFNAIWRTTSSGSVTLTFPMPPLAIGFATSFQGIVFTGGPTVVAISNAVNLYVAP